MVLKQKLRQQFQDWEDWEAPQIEDLKLIIPQDYRFMTSNSFFIDIPNNLIEKIAHIKFTLPLGTYKTSLDTSPTQKLSLHCKQINGVKNEVHK